MGGRDNRHLRLQPCLHGQAAEVGCLRQARVFDNDTVAVAHARIFPFASRRLREASPSASFAIETCSCSCAWVVVGSARQPCMRLASGSRRLPRRVLPTLGIRAAKLRLQSLLRLGDVAARTSYCVGLPSTPSAQRDCPRFSPKWSRTSRLVGTGLQMHQVVDEVCEQADAPGPFLQAAWRLHWLAAGREACLQPTLAGVKRTVVKDPKSAHLFLAGAGQLLQHANIDWYVERYCEYMLHSILEEATMDTSLAQSDEAISGDLGAIGPAHGRVVRQGTQGSAHSGSGWRRLATPRCAISGGRHGGPRGSGGGDVERTSTSGAGGGPALSGGTSLRARHTCRTAPRAPTACMGHPLRRPLGGLFGWFNAARVIAKCKSCHVLRHGKPHLADSAPSRFRRRARR